MRVFFDRAPRRRRITRKGAGWPAAVLAVRKSLVVLTALTAGFIGCDNKNPVSNNSALWEPAGGAIGTQTVQVIKADLQTRGTLYAGSLEGIFKSTDYGNTWTESSVGLSNRAITSLTVSPEISSLIFCGTWGKGVFRSRDAGQSWQSCWPTTQNMLITDLCLQAGAPTPTLWAGTSAGLFRSRDEGNTWSEVGRFGFINLVHPSGAASQTLMISINKFGVYRSLDDGATWLPANNGMLQDSYGQEAPLAMCTDPLNRQTCFAVTDRDRFYRSQDGGSNWLQLDLDHYRVPEPVSLYSETNRSGYLWLAGRSAGVYRSTDSGASWARIDTGLESVQIKTVIAGCWDKTILLAGTVGKGIYRYEEK